jgi:hypothetical protein
MFSLFITSWTLMIKVQTILIGQWSVIGPDPHFFGHPRSLGQRYRSGSESGSGSGFGSFPVLIKVLSGQK